MVKDENTQVLYCICDTYNMSTYATQ